MALKNLCPLVQQARLQACKLIDELQHLESSLADTANGGRPLLVFSAHRAQQELEQLRGYVQLVINARDAGAYRGRAK